LIKQAFLAPKVKNAFKRAVELNPQNAQAHIALAEFYLIAPSIVVVTKRRMETAG